MVEWSQVSNLNSDTRLEWTSGSMLIKVLWWGNRDNGLYLGIAIHCKHTATTPNVPMWFVMTSLLDIVT